MTQHVVGGRPAYLSVDPATLPAAGDAADVRSQAGECDDLVALDAAISVCRACPRLVAWREAVASERRKAFRDQEYWGRPIPGWGPEDASVVVVGLAPAAHGGNRTGRIFTGDRSGDWIFAALHRAGLAERPISVDVDDGQALIDTRMVAAVRCAPPDNKPTPGERDTCAGWYDRELELLAPTMRTIVVLGGFAWQALWPSLVRLGYPVPRPRPKFGHGAQVALDDVLVLGCYHPSQQNTFTGRLTETMLDDVFALAASRR
ncbi:MAG: uracil-DNA glycosylase [Actinomycetes bacterium]